MIMMDSLFFVPAAWQVQWCIGNQAERLRVAVDVPSQTLIKV